MKKVIALFMFLATLLVAAPLKFATSPDYPPFEFIKNGTYVGVDMEILSVIAQRAGFEYEIIQTHFDHVLNAVQNQSVDFGISAITNTAERAKIFDFSNAYYEAVQLFIGLEGNNFNSKDSLVGKKIGVLNAGSLQEKIAQSISDSKVIATESLVNLIIDIKTGKVDAIIIESTNAPAVLFDDFDNVSKKDQMSLDMLKSLGLGKKLEIFNIETSEDSEFAIITKKGTHGEILTKINAAIESMKNDGTIEKILAKYKVK